MTEEVQLKAELNDRFRVSGKAIALSNGVSDIYDLDGLLREIRHFQGFSPYIEDVDEHDFGSLYWDGKQIFWRINYYNGKRRLRVWEDPLDQDCNRMITVMLASEY